MMILRIYCEVNRQFLVIAWKNDENIKLNFLMRFKNLIPIETGAHFTADNTKINPKETFHKTSKDDNITEESKLDEWQIFFTNSAA